jgi:hypothetical protein
MLSESLYRREWNAARRAALGPELAVTALARYVRHYVMKSFVFSRSSLG